MRTFVIYILFLFAHQPSALGQFNYSLDSLHSDYYLDPSSVYSTTKLYVIDKNEDGQALNTQTTVYDYDIQAVTWSFTTENTYFENGDQASLKHYYRFHNSSYDTTYVGHHIKFNPFGEIVWLRERSFGTFSTPDTSYLGLRKDRLDTTEIETLGRPIYRPKYDLQNGKERIGYQEYRRTNGRLDTLFQYGLNHNDTIVLRYTTVYEYDSEEKLLAYKVKDPMSDTVTVHEFDYSERYQKETIRRVNMLTKGFRIKTQTQHYYLDDNQIDSVIRHRWNTQTQSWDLETRTKYFYSLRSTNIQHWAIPSSAIEVFPNPVDDVLQLSAAEPFSNKVSLKIFTLQGKLVYQQNQSVLEQVQIDTSPLSNGVYILSINNSYMKKFRVLHQ
ncbi:MAG: T9SS type A sorting domain-containing protein [Bacteroidota bacterium]